MIDGNRGGDLSSSPHLRVAAYYADRLRNLIKKSLGFSISIGISHNKMLAKLTASKSKPFGLSVLPREGVPTFLGEARLFKARGFGGKFGKKVLEMIQSYGVKPPTNGDENDYRMSDLNQVSEAHMKREMGDKDAEYLKGIARADEFEPVEETETSSVKQVSSESLSSWATCKLSQGNDDTTTSAFF